jgi:hypothetical protein
MAVSAAAASIFVAITPIETTAARAAVTVASHSSRVPTIPDGCVINGRMRVGHSGVRSNQSWNRREVQRRHARHRRNHRCRSHRLRDVAHHMVDLASRVGGLVRKQPYPAPRVIALAGVVCVIFYALVYWFFRIVSR